MKIALLSAVLLFSSFMLLSCKKDNPIPPGEQPQISLTLEDASCTEAWIKLTTANISLPAEVALFKDDNAVGTISLTKADTLIYLDSLLPNHTYKYQSVIQSAGQKSNLLDVTTMDTTSHNFTWQSWTFGGQAGSCTLYDVAIINENDIWAVGEIYLPDTTGVPDPNAYNAVHWDGSQWGLKRIKTNACGGVEYPPIKAIFAFSSDNILFAHIDGSITHYNGIKFTNDCSLITQLDGSANKIWGISQNDYYVVSGNGFIAHYQNGQWSRIESGTDLNINDVWGDYDELKSVYEINMIAAHHFEGPERKILTIKNNVIEELPTINIADGGLDAIWFKSQRKYFVVGNGIYSKMNISDSNSWNASLDSLTPYYCYAVRGTALNNIFICGSFGESLHFNGRSWKSFRTTPGFYNTEFYDLAIKGELVVLVGQSFQSGFIAIGKIQ
jgi:hypothetical protein